VNTTAHRRPALAPIALAAAYVAVGVAAAAHAVRSDRRCRLFGIAIPGTVRQQALTTGTALSAPPLMWVALLAAIRRRRHETARVLAAAFLAGVAAEPDTPATLRTPGADPLATACTVLDIVLPLAMLASLASSD
jgi:hypothetical protein